jgi:hypothetical protein
MVRGRIIIGVAVAVSFLALSGPSFAELFDKRIEYPGLNGPKGIVAADFDLDGRIDLAVANQGKVGALNDSISVLLNLGGGAFGPQIPLRTGEGPYAICAADLDGDGDPDLVAANRSGSTVTVLINDGHAAFANTSSPTVGLYPTDVRAADLDRDGDLDLVVSNILTTNVSVLINNGDGTFLPKVDYPITDAGNTVCPADVNGDLFPDLAVGGPFGVDLLINNGNGTFHPGGQVGFGTSRNYINSADFDGDGDVDLVTTDLMQSKISVFLNNGDGSFPAPIGYTVPDWGDQVVPADLDNDGDIDLAASLNFTGQLIVLLNDGAGNFSIETTYDAGDRSVGVCVTDINGDGDLDVAVANDASDDIGVFINTLYPARMVIEPNPMNFQYAYSIYSHDGYITLGNFDPPCGAADLELTSLRINDSVVPLSTEILPPPPDFDGDITLLTFDLAEFVRGYGVLWGTASYPYAVTGDFSDGSPFADTGELVIYGFLPGDANGDGAVDIGDAVVIISYLYRNESVPACPEAGDLAGIEGIDLADAIVLINYIFKEGSLPEIRH